MEALEILGGVVLALAALIGAVAVAVRIASTQSKQAFSVLQTELDQEKTEAGRLRTRVTDLELSLKGREEKIARLDKQLETVCEQLENVQKRLTDAEGKLQERDATIERLMAENDRIKHQSAELFKANSELAIEVRTYQKAFTWMGIQRAEIEKIKTDDLTAAAAKVTPPDDPPPDAPKSNPIDEPHQKAA